MDFIKLVNDEFKSGKEHPKFTVGDTITIEYRIKEGNKERIQKYRGTVRCVVLSCTTSVIVWVAQHVSKNAANFLPALSKDSLPQLRGRRLFGAA